MNPEIPRLRMFAGPNGSGKSTIRTLLPPELVGVYVNPDEIQAQLEKSGELHLSRFNVSQTPNELASFLASSTLMSRSGLLQSLQAFTFTENTVAVPKELVNAYLASVIADFIRRKLLASRKSFTFETVMSSADKIDVLKLARSLGFRTYLYYIATEDPAINISRVKNRVQLGGHPVPDDKIVSRYSRSLELLYAAIRETDRAYLFDNSGAEQIWIAEITNRKTLELKVNQAPRWFQQAVLDKATPPES